jgi:hypothetical protein
MTSAASTVWAKERAMLAELDARYEDEINGIYCEHLGRMIQMGE